MENSISRQHSFCCAVAMCLSVLLVGEPATGQILLYSDDFDSGTSASGWGTFDTGDAASNFAFDYSSVGVPSAPNSNGGSTVGLRMSVNDTAGAPHAISAYPLGESFSGNHVLKFDMWINYKIENEVNDVKLRPHPHEFFLYYDI